jgi:hypothetical protein
MAAGGAVKIKRPWLEPLSPNGIPLQIFGNFIKFVNVKKNGILTEKRIYSLRVTNY